MDGSSSHMWSYLYNSPLHAKWVWPGIYLCVWFKGHIWDIPVIFTHIIPFLIDYVCPFNLEQLYIGSLHRSHVDTSTNNPVPSWIRKKTAELQQWISCWPISVVQHLWPVVYTNVHCNSSSLTSNLPSLESSYMMIATGTVLPLWGEINSGASHLPY